MPTGYTACIEDGTVTDFKTFATRCLRAMGCCIMQREDDMSDLPKHREPTTYHTDEAEKSRMEIGRLRGLTEKQIRAAMKDEHDKAVSYRAECAERHDKENARYDAMTKSVEAWKPPTKEHENFKAFMLEQLRLSRHTYMYEPKIPKSVPPEQWRQAQIAKQYKDVAYHTKEHADELKRCEDSNRWMDAALASFETVTV